MIGRFSTLVDSRSGVIPLTSPLFRPRSSGAPGRRRNASALARNRLGLAENSLMERLRRTVVQLEAPKRFILDGEVARLRLAVILPDNTVEVVPHRRVNDTLQNTSTTRPSASSRSKTASHRKCYRCPRPE